MIALILAAGVGRRLGKLTEQVPKALVNTAGMPLLGRILYDLESVEVRDVWIVVGFKGDEIRRKIREDYAGLKIHYVENPDYKKGNLYSFLAARGLLEKNFILCMADHLFDAYLNTVEDLKRGKSVLAERTQKGRGASDLVAHYINRPIENKIIYYISDSNITPNQLTIMTNIIAWSVTVLFFLGHLLAGAILTFIVGVIDGLDGKLARLKKRTTKLGLMEHPFDMLFEFSWLIALALYLSRSIGSLPLILSLITVTLIAFYRFCYDQFGRAMKISLDVYAPFEKAFRRIAGRRNLYNIHILAWVILGMPLYSLYTIMGHSVLTALVYAYRACKHLHIAESLYDTPCKLVANENIYWRLISEHSSKECWK